MRVRSFHFPADFLEFEELFPFFAGLAFALGMGDLAARVALSGSFLAFLSLAAAVAFGTALVVVAAAAFVSAISAFVLVTGAAAPAATGDLVAVLSPCCLVSEGLFFGVGAGGTFFSPAAATAATTHSSTVASKSLVTIP